MYDYYRLVADRSSIDNLENNQRLKFVSKMHHETGEVEPTRIAEYKGQRIKITGSGNVYISGSIHKFFNDGKHNYNHYTFSDFEESLIKMKAEIGIEPSKTIIQNVEVGVNLRGLSASTTSVLSSCLFHKKKPFKDVSMSNGHYRKCAYNQYVLKAYDKGRQYHLSEGVFRWEIKFLRSQRINGSETYSLEDLKKPAACSLLGNQLLKAWDQVMFFDGRLFKTLQGDDLNQAFKWTNQQHWEELGELTIGSKKNNYYREKKRFIQFSNSCSSLHSEIHEAIKEQVGTFYTNSIR